jgi:colicin import membrane protein
VRQAPPPPEPRQDADIATHKAAKPKPEPVKPAPEPKKAEARKPDPKLEARDKDKERRAAAAAEAAETAREAKAAAERRKATLAAMQAKIDQLAGPEGPGTASGSRGGTARSGGAAVATGPSPGYEGRIRARILPNIVYTGRALGNPTAEVEVSLAPDGTILKSRLLKGSGIEDWDQAVLRAIERTGTLPVDTDGRIPPKMVLSFDPNKR